MRIATLIMVAAAPAAAALVLTSAPLHFTAASAVVFAQSSDRYEDDDRNLNRDLSDALSAAKFTGEIEQTFRKKIEKNLGRPVNPKLANLGRLLWFDKFQSLGRDNSCGGCHSPTNGMGDSQPMAIGVQNNNLVGPHRAGPRNQRRAPTVVNAALYPNMMWNSRLASVARSPFDNSLGFSLSFFPVPEDLGTPTAPIRFSSRSEQSPRRHASSAGTSTFASDGTDRARGLQGNLPQRRRRPVVGTPLLPVRRRRQPWGAAAFARFERLPQRADSTSDAGGAERIGGLPRPVPGALSRDWTAAEPADRLLHVRQGDCRVRIHARLRRRAARPVRPRVRGLDDRVSKARGAAVLRQGEMRRVSSRRRRLERDVQRLRGTRGRRASERADVRRPPRQRHLLGSRRGRGLSAARSGRATRRIATSSARRRCATWPCPPRSSTTAPTRVWTKPSGFT